MSVASPNVHMANVDADNVDHTFNIIQGRSATVVSVNAKTKLSVRTLQSLSTLSSKPQNTGEGKRPQSFSPIRSGRSLYAFMGVGSDLRELNTSNSQLTLAQGLVVGADVRSSPPTVPGYCPLRRDEFSIQTIWFVSLLKWWRMEVH